MSGQGIIYDTSPFNAEATRPALAESDITPIATVYSPQSRPDPKHCDGSMVSDGGRPGRAVSRSQRYLTFAAAILVTGVLSGVVGGFTTVLVRTLEHLSFGYDQGPLLIGVRDASIERRLIGLATGCALAGLGWWLLRRKTSVPIHCSSRDRVGQMAVHGPNNAVVLTGCFPDKDLRLFALGGDAQRPMGSTRG